MTISESDRISLMYYLHEPPSGEMYSFMLMEDYCRNIASFYGSSRSNISCRIEPFSAESLEVFKRLFPGQHRRYHRDNLSDIVLSSIESIAAALVSRGLVVLELVKLIDEEGKTFYRLETINGDDVLVKKDTIIQIIPIKVVEEQRCNHQYTIPKNKCYIMRYPKTLGGGHKYIRSLSEFKKIGGLSPLVSNLNDSFVGIPGYNWKEHNKMFQLEMWRKSKFVNWHHRQYSGEDYSSFYTVYRRLLFQKTRFILRDSIIEQLKVIFNLCSKVIGSESQLTIEGFSPISNLDQIILKWTNGDIGAKEIVEAMN